MLSGLYHSQTLKPDRSQKPDPKQKRHHPSPVCTGKKSGAVGSNKGEKGKGTGQAPNWKPISWAKRESSAVLRTQLTGVLSRKSCSSTWQCRQRDGCYLQDSKDQKLQNEQEERGFAHLLLRTRTFTYPSKTLSVLKEACQVFHW